MRDHSIDLVRTLGIVAIVAGHVWSGELIDRTLYSWHVPVFFFLTGYLWTQGRSLADETQRRARTLIKPYVFWMTVLLLVFTTVTLIRGDLSFMDAVRPLYGGYFATQPFSTFWFVFVLFASAVLWRMLERTPLWARVGVVVLGVGAASVAGELLAKTPLAIGSAVPALFFVAFGQFARSQAGSRVVSIAIVGAAVAGGVLISFGVVAPLDIKQGDWGTPVASMITSAVLVWAIVLVARLVAASPVRFGEAATRFAMVGFTVVLAHPLVLWLLPGVAGWAQFLLAIALPFAVGTVALRSALAQWVTGAPRASHPG